MPKVIKLRTHDLAGKPIPRCQCGKTVYSGVWCYKHYQEKNERIRKRLKSSGLY